MTYISNAEGINLIDSAATTIMKTVKNDWSFSEYKLPLYKSGVIITDPAVHRKIWIFQPLNNSQLEIFAVNNKNIHAEGLALECSFCKPCGIAVEFDDVVYITDIDTLIPIE